MDKAVFQLGAAPMARVGRVVVITGASSGIGQSTASLFARRGWRVGLIARGAPGLASAHALLDAGGTAVAACAADVADGAALEAAAVYLEGELGPIDVWVNCAGNGVYCPFLRVPEAEFARVTDVTYMGTVNGTRVALRRMVGRDAGRVVNVCSAIAFHGLPMLSSYSGAKHAVRGFTESVRHELQMEGSRVGLALVFPPAVNTPFFAHAASHMARPPRPAAPVYQPEVVADAILLAATSNRREVRVSGVTAVFAMAARLVPGLVHRAIQRLGAAGQMTDLPAAQLRDPTLFAPSAVAAGTHGPFDAESRRFSVQMWLTRRRLPVAAVLAALAVAFGSRWVMPAAPAAPSLPRPPAPAPGPAPPGLPAPGRSP